MLHSSDASCNWMATGFFKSPDLRFTKDGYRDSRYSADALSGIKRLENNQAVHGQVVMWAEFLQKETLFSRHKFYPLLQFTADSGFDDPDWLKREEDVKVVQESMRHVNISTTMNIYTKALTSVKREATAQGMS